MAALGFNQRRHKRKAVSMQAAIELHNGAPIRACVVLDISQGGACLAVDPLPLPEKFTLLLSPSGNVRRSCLLRWRNDEQAGVQFV